MAVKQYAVPTPGGVIYVNEANAGKQYGVPTGYLNDTSASVVTVAPAAGAILFAGFAPNANAGASPASGTIAFTGFAPNSNAGASPAAGTITFIGRAPSADINTGATTPPAGSILFTGFAPTIPAVNSVMVSIIV